MKIRDLTPQAKQERSLLTKYEEVHPFQVFEEEMTKVMDNFFRGFGLERFEKKPGVFNPSVDVIDTGKQIKVTAELPGMDEMNVEVSLTREALTIKGEKEDEREEKEKGYYHMERSYGSFVRTIPIPVEVEMDKVKATFKKGILTINLPKAEKVLKDTKKIAIRSE